MFKQILKQIFAPEQTAKAPVDIFANIYGLDVVKRLTKQIIHANKPVNAIIIGPPGLGKSELIRAVANAYPTQAVEIDGTYVTAAGTVDVLHNKYLEMRDKQQKIFLLIDEIEKADKKSNQVLLNIIEGGRITKTTKTEKFDINMNVSLIATCNDFETLKKTQPALVSRMMIIKIEPPTLEEFMTIAKFRLARENIPAELATYIGQKVFETFGTDMRQAVRLAVLAKTEADVDQTIADMKEVGL